MNFLNTIKQIRDSDAVSTWRGLRNHLVWQARKLLRLFPVELSISHSRVAVDSPGGVAALINCMGMYDFNNMHLIQFLLAHRSKGIFFDVGANEGAYTLVASEVSSAQVYAFEPHPVAFSRLSKNVDINRRENVTLMELALSDRDGMAELVGLSDLSLSRIVLAQPQAVGQVIPVKIRTLDGICNELGAWPDILKIDVEGHELAVLHGFEKSLPRTEVLLVENGERRSAHAWLTQHGMSGPFWCDFTRRTFDLHPQRRREDSVYLSKNAQRNLGSLGFLFAQ